MLLLGAVACLGVSLAQFRLSREVKEATVILVLDVSNSMGKTDVVPSRLAAAQDAAKTFLEKLPPDFRVGLVTFAGEPTVEVPVTADRALVSQALDGLTLSAGTVIGDGLNSALEALRDDRAENGEGPAAMLLLSDGVDTGSDVLPLVAAERAATAGTPVFTVVLGSPDQSEGHKADPLLLQAIARQTGGQPFTAESADELTGIYSTLGSTLSVQLAVTSIGAPFLWGAGILALAAGFALVRGTPAVDWRN